MMDIASLVHMDNSANMVVQSWIVGKRYDANVTYCTRQHENDALRECPPHLGDYGDGGSGKGSSSTDSGVLVFGMSHFIAMCQGGRGGWITSSCISSLIRTNFMLTLSD